MTTSELANAIRQHLQESSTPIEDANALTRAIHEEHPLSANPVTRVEWLPIEDVQPNDYNPNSVAPTEMQLLLHSIQQDGYTQPIVTVKDPDTGKRVIVDGFHRYRVMLTNTDLRDSTNGHVPVVTLDKDINDRMASTVRHNRARGAHSVTGMSNMVFQMLENGWSDEEICNELGMHPEELIRLKHITGFSKLFADHEYSRAWLTKRQVRARIKYQQENPDDPLPPLS